LKIFSWGDGKNLPLTAHWLRWSLGGLGFYHIRLSVATTDDLDQFEAFQDGAVIPDRTIFDTEIGGVGLLAALSD
jgi:hypothetical protein